MSVRASSRGNQAVWEFSSEGRGVPETARRKKLSPLDVVTLRLDGGEEEYQAVREE